MLQMFAVQLLKPQFVDDNNVSNKQTPSLTLRQR